MKFQINHEHARFVDPTGFLVPPLLSFFSAPAIACTMPQFRGKKCHFLPRAIEARLLLSR